MRTKIFLSFLTVIVVAIVSNVIFKNLIVRDFDDYRAGVQQANIYWLIASVEDSFEDGKWNHSSLMDAVHWGLMLGLDMDVFDVDGKNIMDNTHVFAHISSPMRLKMEHLIRTSRSVKEYKSYYIFSSGKRVGQLRFKPLIRREIRKKEDIFKERLMRFMIVSFTIAGAGSLLLAILFSVLLSLPLKRLKDGAARIARGDFDTRLSHKGHDEIGSLTESFNNMAEALKRDADIRKHVMADIAHQLRTPLTIIKANAEAVIDGVVEHSGAVQDIKGEAEKLVGLIKSIEELTRAEAAFFKHLDSREFSLKDFIIETVSRYRQLARNKSIDIFVKGSDTIINTDGEVLSAILDNLLSNAIRYTNEGRIDVECGGSTSAFYVKVKDTGIGISDEELPFVFERFYKGRHSTGMGIGLSIVKELVSALRGEINIKSVYGQGTEVTLSIPSIRRRGSGVPPQTSSQRVG